jgi:hypothetical protein
MRNAPGGAAAPRDGYGLEPEEVEIAVRWLQLNHPEEPIGLPKVLKLGKQKLRLLPGEAGEWGGDRKSDQRRITTSIEHRHTVPGILRRLNRDRPELAEKVANGELSANAAAIEAGFRKKLAKFEQIVKWLPSLTATERRKLKEMLE